MKLVAKEWQLVGHNLIVNRHFQIGFHVHALGQVLEATVINFRDPDQVFSDDVEALKKLAPRAYRNAIGMRRNAKKAVPN
jgi:hypothetical protein